MTADHLSRIPNAPVKIVSINKNFPDEHILVMCEEPWYADIAYYLATGRQTPSSWSNQDKPWYSDIAYSYYLDHIIRRCLPEDEHHSVLIFCPEFACSGHFGPRKTTKKVLQSSFYWPTLFKDSYNFCKLCAKCQMIGRVTHKDMMSLTPILQA